MSKACLMNLYSVNANASVALGQQAKGYKFTAIHCPIHNQKLSTFTSYSQQHTCLFQISQLHPLVSQKKSSITIIPILTLTPPATIVSVLPESSVANCK